MNRFNLNLPDVELKLFISTLTSCLTLMVMKCKMHLVDIYKHGHLHLCIMTIHSTLTVL